MREGAGQAAGDGLAEVVLLSARPLDGVETIDPQTLGNGDPLEIAAAMVARGEADGTLAGATRTTADTVRAAIRTIGARERGGLVSSFFLMILGQAHHAPLDRERGAVVFADCGLVIEPDPAQLARIASDAADSFKRLTGEGPRVAFLSFSTAGSARHARVDRVREGLTLFQALRPDVPAGGELQFDAAFVPDVAAAKAPDDPLGGRANVFVFPSLEAGNIAYKVAERIGGAVALGPVLQGLARPANDLSRGCSAADVAAMIAVTACQVKD